MEFKDKVKAVRRRRLLLSQADLAKELDVAYTTINRWENWLRTPTFVLQRKFYAFCNRHFIKFEE